MLPLLSNSFFHLLVLLCGFNRLLLCILHRHHNQPGLRIGEFEIYLYLFGRLEFGFLFFFQKKSGVRLAHVEKGWGQIFLGDSRLGLDISHGQHGIFIKKHADSCLKHVHNELMLLLSHKERFQFNCAHLVQPRQVPVLIFILIKHCKLISARLEHCGNIARNVGRNRPVSGHKYFCTEAYFTNKTPALALKLALKIFAKLNVSKHLRHLIHSVEAAFHFQFVQHALFGFA